MAAYMSRKYRSDKPVGEKGMRNRGLYLIPTRRQAILGGAGFVGATAIGGGRAEALLPWLSAVTAAVAAGWLIEALKGWGLTPGTNLGTSVAGSHAQEAAPLQQQGYNIQPKYSGGYSGGDFKLSEAIRGGDFLVLSTTSHGTNTCTHKFDSADTTQLGLAAKLLRSKGINAPTVQALTLPVHPPGANQFVGSERQSPVYLTPSHGTIAWSMDLADSRPNFVTSIRSGPVNVDLLFAQRDDGGWNGDVQDV
jgi:hypothetical protein